MNQAAKILIVDDNPVVLFGMSHLLGSAGFVVVQATTGAEGLERAKQTQPDLVLLDVLLPDFNGIELCRKIKADPATQHLFVVLLSSFETSSDSQVTGLEAGADGYIARPIENRELLARVQAMLRISQAESALRCAHDELERRVAERTAELSLANAALRGLSQRLVDVQEAERRFVTRELHDEIGQMVTSLKILLETSLRPATPAEQHGLEEVLQLINDLMDYVRRLSVDLRPQMLDDLGLLTALEWHFKRYHKQTGIQVRFKHTPFPQRLSSRLETAIFRIAQEALTNVARYAGVKEATVRLWKNDERVRIQVDDRGAGFQWPLPNAERVATGLSGMKERAELLGGEFTLDSAPGHGTCVTVELPLEPAQPASMPEEQNA
ncbi:MAG TPA: response regulator [Verrucomicrobiae bacterium]|nr:response regulator [Verrucomicrobiae bacterium]